MSKRVKFRLQVGAVVISGEADGTNLSEDWRWLKPVAPGDPQEVNKLTLTLKLGGDVRGRAKRGTDPVHRFGKKTRKSPTKKV